MQCTLGPAHLDIPTSQLEVSFLLLHRNSYLSGIYMYMSIKSSGKTNNKIGGRRENQE